MKRYTFIVQIHPDGISTIENLSTHERVRIREPAAAGPQIERWLSNLRDPAARAATPPGTDSGRTESTPE